MTNGSSPGPWLSERKSVRKLAKLELIPVEIMRTQWQEPSPWLQCDSHVQRTMVISGQARNPTEVIAARLGKAPPQRRGPEVGPRQGAHLQ
jgi:hypothetical protein